MSATERSAAFEWGLESGQALERERIIKLLETDCHRYTEEIPCPCGAPTPEQVDYLIALIKGENK